MGHHSEVAYNGSAALDKINRFSPELFLLDLALPDMDGYELVRRLRPLAGKEAGPMRQALFAVLLVAASFAGGAVVNGPGLRWAQDHGATTPLFRDRCWGKSSLFPDNPTKQRFKIHAVSLVILQQRGRLLIRQSN